MSATTEVLNKLGIENTAAVGTAETIISSASAVFGYADTVDKVGKFLGIWGDTGPKLEEQLNEIKQQLQAALEKVLEANKVLAELQLRSSRLRELQR